MNIKSFVGIITFKFSLCSHTNRMNTTTIYTNIIVNIPFTFSEEISVNFLTINRNYNRKYYVPELQPNALVSIYRKL